MKKIILFYFAILLFNSFLFAQDNPGRHPNTSGEGWVNVFNNDLSNAIFPKGIWTISDGVMTASADEAIWSEKTYNDFVLDLEFKTADGTNSGVIVPVSYTHLTLPTKRIV